MTLLGPIEKLHFWHVISTGRGNHGHTRGNAERRDIETADEERPAGIEARYVYRFRKGDGE